MTGTEHSKTYSSNEEEELFKIRYILLGALYRVTTRKLAGLISPVKTNANAV